MKIKSFLSQNFDTQGEPLYDLRFQLFGIHVDPEDHNKVIGVSLLCSNDLNYYVEFSEKIELPSHLENKGKFIIDLVNEEMKNIEFGDSIINDAVLEILE
jgi:hypothetical protein